MTTRLGTLTLSLVLFWSARAAAQPPPPTPAPEPAAPEPSPQPSPAPAPEPEPVAAPAAAPEPVATTTAEAGPLGTAFGVGIHGMLTGPFGPAIVYNLERFHIEGLLAFESNGATALTAGGRFWFHAHQTSASTLSLGGGLAFSSTESEPIPPETRSDDQTVFHLEGGAQIRFFPVSNVAISASVGLGILSGDADLFVLTGQLTGGAGLTYFFR